MNTWIHNNRVWLFPAVFILVVGTGWFFVSGMNKVVADMGHAYSEPELYEQAVAQLNTNEQVLALFGPIGELDNLAILEGETSYSKMRDSITSSVRIVGDKAKGRCDIRAHKSNGTWQFDFLQARIKSPPESKATVIVID
ncbi:MAG: cytochrome c oxidase assembly factor Coa1 family protein [Gilvibacter sp.]